MGMPDTIRVDADREPPAIEDIVAWVEDRAADETDPFEGLVFDAAYEEEV